MATTSLGFRYPLSSDHKRLWEHFQNLAIDVDTHLAVEAVEDFETANDTDTSTSYVAGTTNGVAFVAPASGIVLVSFCGHLGSNSIVVATSTPASRMSTQVREGSTVGSGTIVMAASDDRSAGFFNYSTSAGFKYNSVAYQHLVTGLTPGSSYNAITVFKEVTTAATAAVDNRRITVKPC